MCLLECLKEKVEFLCVGCETKNFFDLGMCEISRLAAGGRSFYKKSCRHNTLGCPIGSRHSGSTARVLCLLHWTAKLSLKLQSDLPSIRSNAFLQSLKFKASLLPTGNGLTPRFRPRPSKQREQDFIEGRLSLLQPARAASSEHLSPKRHVLMNHQQCHFFFQRPYHSPYIFNDNKIARDVLPFSKEK